MRKLAFLAAAYVAFVALTSSAVAQTNMPKPPPGMPMPMPGMEHMMMAMHAPQQLSVAATGSVEYVPDVARINLGIRSDSPSATTAIDSINKSSAQVIAALKGVGIATASIKTVGYNLFYRAPPVQPPAGATLLANQGTGTYEASEALLVSAPVALAGRVLDAAIGAGANESFGLSYQTTNYDSLYRQALAKAVASARATADAMARAAHVSIVQIQSISNSTEQPEAGMRMMAAMPTAMNGANVMPGTDAVSASVFVVYRVR